jgi:hypothetical protein
VLTKFFWCHRGAVAVEAAIIFPVLTLLVMGMIEFALLFFTFSSLQTAVRDVSRQVSVNFAQPEEAENAVRERIPAWSRDAVAVTLAQSNPGDPEQNVLTLRATLPASSTTPLNFLTNTIGDWTLETQVVMKQELLFTEVGE